MDNKALIPPGLSYLADNIKLKGNILGASKEEGARWAKGLNLPKEKETIFFAGCGYQFEDKLESLMGLVRKMDKSFVGSDMAMGLAGFQRKLGIDASGAFLKVMGRGKNSTAEPLVDAIKILNKLGINPGYLAENEPCCGGILHYAGLQKDFSQYGQQVYTRLKSKGVKRIVGIVPSCTYTLRKLLADVTPGYDLEVKHFCEILSDDVKSLRLRYPKSIKVAYHDPCQLVRYLGLVEEPRRILRAIEGLELVETKWTKGEWSTCCGGGGGFEAVFPEMSEMLAVNRAKELLETGADIIVTHCPGCIMQLEAGLKVLKAEKVEVLDLTQLVARSLEV